MNRMIAALVGTFNRDETIAGKAMNVYNRINCGEFRGITN